MLEPRNLLISVLAVAVLTMLGYMLVQMIHPDPYAGTIVSHAEKENGMAASQALAMVKAEPRCGTDISRDELLRYYGSQECFMLGTEMRTRRRPTAAALSGHGKAFTTGLSSRLKQCMSPELQRGLLARIESGRNLGSFLDEIDRAKGEAGKLERIAHLMHCGS